MKKLIITALLTTSMALGTFSNSKEYPTCGTVVSVNHETDVVVFEDFNGLRWGFKGAEDWMVDDIIAVIMNDQGTETIFDDEIVDVKYCGYVE